FLTVRRPPREPVRFSTAERLTCVASTHERSSAMPGLRAFILDVFKSFAACFRRMSVAVAILHLPVLILALYACRNRAENSAEKGGESNGPRDNQGGHEWIILWFFQPVLPGWLRVPWHPVFHPSPFPLRAYR